MIRQWNYFDFCWVIFPKKFFGDSSWPADTAGEDQEKGEKINSNLTKQEIWGKVKDIGRPSSCHYYSNHSRLWTEKRKEDAPSESWILQKLDHTHCYVTKKRYVMDMRGERRRVEEGPPRKWYNNHSYFVSDLRISTFHLVKKSCWSSSMQWDLIRIDGPPSQYKYHFLRN